MIFTGEEMNISVYRKRNAVDCKNDLESIDENSWYEVVARLAKFAFDHEPYLVAVRFGDNEQGRFARLNFYEIEDERTNVVVMEFNNCSCLSCSKHNNLDELSTIWREFVARNCDCNENYNKDMKINLRKLTSKFV